MQVGFFRVGCGLIQETIFTEEGRNYHYKGRKMV